MIHNASSEINKKRCGSCVMSVLLLIYITGCNKLLTDSSNADRPPLVYLDYASQRGSNVIFTFKVNAGQENIIVNYGWDGISHGGSNSVTVEKNRVAVLTVLRAIEEDKVVMIEMLSSADTMSGDYYIKISDKTPIILYQYRVLLNGGSLLANHNKVNLLKASGYGGSEGQLWISIESQ